MKRRLTIIIEREGDGYVTLCPKLDIASQGDTAEEARNNLREALELFFETASPAEVSRRLSGEDCAEPAEIVFSELRVLSSREVCDILGRHGFDEERRRNHIIIMKRQDADGTTKVAVPDHKELRIGTLRAIIRQSGVPRGEFEA